MCTVLLPPGVNPIAVNKYIISYHISGDALVLTVFERRMAINLQEYFLYVKEKYYWRFCYLFSIPRPSSFPSFTPSFIASFLGPFFYARSQNCEKRLLASICLSVCRSVRPHGTTRLQREGFSLNLIFEYFPKIRRSSQSDKNIRARYIYYNISLNSS